MYAAHSQQLQWVFGWSTECIMNTYTQTHTQTHIASHSQRWRIRWWYVLLLLLLILYFIVAGGGGSDDGGNCSSDIAAAATVAVAAAIGVSPLLIFFILQNINYFIFLNHLTLSTWFFCCCFYNCFPVFVYIFGSTFFTITLNLMRCAFQLLWVLSLLYLLLISFEQMNIFKRRNSDSRLCYATKWISFHFWYIHTHIYTRTYDIELCVYCLLSLYHIGEYASTHLYCVSYSSVQ